MTHSRWLVSARFDLGFFVAPALVSLLVLWLSPAELFARDDLPVWAWVLLIPAIDVSHVYASLYRTYFDPVEFRRRQALYSMVPAVAFVVGTVLYAVDPRSFWRLLAYVAVWHFVRQQYGFLALYSRRCGEGGRWDGRLDATLLYLTTLYPLLYWHTHPRAFVWFVEGDFVVLRAATVASAVGWAYVVCAFAYTVKEGARLVARQPVNVGKNLLLLTTALTWYVGIVHYDSDYAFTVTNVVAHGIPYVALVWIYCRRKWSTRALGGWLRVISQPRWAGAFVGLLVVLAFFEEGLWDLLVWGDHPGIFGGRNHALAVSDSALLPFVVGLLAMPQATHYLLDGFIWKMNADNPDLRKLLGLESSRSPSVDDGAIAETLDCRSDRAKPPRPPACGASARTSPSASRAG